MRNGLAPAACGVLTVFYIVYLAADDSIVATGNAEECARQMGRSVNSFHCLVSRVRSGKNKKFEISSSKEDEIE